MPKRPKRRRRPDSRQKQGSRASDRPQASGRDALDAYRVAARDETTTGDSTDQRAGRNGALDSLRGLAILLMIVDHLAGICFGLTIQDSTIRLVTRLSMPLFCVLMGYFLDPARPRGWRRPTQMLLAAVLVNLVFWPHYGSIEILGTLLLAYGVFLTAGRWFFVAVLVIALYPIDPLRPWFDFPASLVIPFVAQGALLRRFGIWWALLGATWLAAGTIWIDALEPLGVNQKLCLFILPATLLVYLGSTAPRRSVPGLAWMGWHPLSVYVIQYYVVFAIAAVL